MATEFLPFIVFQEDWRLSPNTTVNVTPWEMKKVPLITYHVAFKLNFETCRWIVWWIFFQPNKCSSFPFISAVLHISAGGHQPAPYSPIMPGATPAADQISSVNAPSQCNKGYIVTVSLKAMRRCPPSWESLDFVVYWDSIKNIFSLK